MAYKLGECGRGTTTREAERRRDINYKRSCGRARVAKLEETITAVEKWETGIKEHETLFSKIIDEEVKTATMLSTAPSVVQEYASLNEDRIQTYAQARKLVIDYVEAQRDRGVVPMDVDALHKRLALWEKGKGGKKGAWRGQQKGGKNIGGEPNGGKKGDGKKGDGKKGDGKKGGKDAKQKGGKDGTPEKFDGYCGGCGL